MSIPGPDPLRVGSADREAAVARLRENLDAGRLTATEFADRTATALDAQTQADLDPLFADLPPVVSSGTFELYPHQSVAVPAEQDPRPAGYYLPETSQTPTPAPNQTSPFMAFLKSVPKAVWVAITVLLAIIISTRLNSGVLWMFWWLIFFVPGLWGKDNKKNRNKF